MTQTKPIRRAECPDPDIIRAGDTYYMLSTTLHYLPGGPVFRSYDLIHWEIASYVFDALEHSPAECLQGEQSIYGRGMWESTLRYHKKTFYACFSDYDTGRTWIYSADDVTGPWKRKELAGISYHHTMLFDEDGAAYIAWGSSEVRLTELAEDLSGIKENGREYRLAGAEECTDCYEGSHFYRIDGRYYYLLTVTTEGADASRKLICYSADRISGPYAKRLIREEALTEHNIGSVFGGLVDTPERQWYAAMFGRFGMLGTLPEVCPVVWEKDACSIDTAKPLRIGSQLKSNRPNYEYEPLCSGDIFTGRMKGAKPELSTAWQWNHEPNDRLWRRTEDGGLGIRTGKISINLLQAVNTLTQRIVVPSSMLEVSLDMTELGSGDYAGIGLLQGNYAWIGVTKEIGRYFLVHKSQSGSEESRQKLSADFMPGVELVKFVYEGNLVRLRIVTTVTESGETAEFYYRNEGKWEKIGSQKLSFRQDPAVGCRLCMFIYSTIKTGGEAVFYNASFTNRT